MVETQKTLTIKETKNIIEQLQNELELYLEKKKINFNKTQPSAMKLKEVISSKTNNIFDSFTTYMIKDEECDDKIYSLVQSILSYQSYVIKELDRMRQYDDLSLIVYLKEELEWNWKDIDKYLHYAEDTSRTKYKRFKNSGKK